MNLVFWLALSAAIVVLVFDYTNGFHDAANIVATMIASRAMAPAQAVLLVGVFEFLGPLLGGTPVANTIGKFVQLDAVPAPMALSVLLCGLLGAITWNLVTWRKGIPSSSSHALVGGLIGAVVVATGFDNVVWGLSELLHGGHVTGVTKVLLALVLSPLLGFWVAFAIHKVMQRLLAGARPKIGRDLRRAQFVTAAGLAFSYGANATTMYNISGSTPAARTLASLGTDACLHLNRAVIALADRNGGAAIIERCRQIDALDAQASATMREAVTQLFQREGDGAAAWHAVKMRRFCFTQAAVLDGCRRAANTIDEILLENA